MSNAIRVIVQDYGWIHLSIGLLGNTLFFSGSILYLPAFDQLRSVPIWMFICGSGLMLIGALGRLLVSLYED